MEPREVLERFRRAAIERSVDELRGLYAADAVHEFPFTRPGLPARLSGRDEIVDWIAAGWRDLPIRYESYRTLARLDTADPRTIVVEQEAVGRNTATGRPFALPNIVVLTVGDGRIAHLRDYVNVLAAAEAIGGL
jgi:ketosteroid isomerase-like protein